MNLNNMDTFTAIVFGGLLVTSILLAFALLLRQTNGLFWARTTEQFKKDRHNPRFAKERNAGQRFSVLVIHYVSPIFVAFLLLLILRLVFK